MLGLSCAKLRRRYLLTLVVFQLLSQYNHILLLQRKILENKLARGDVAG
jgi:hypothetical protein